MGACVIDQQLKALTTLAEDQSLVPRIHLVSLQPPVTTALGNSIAWFL